MLTCKEASRLLSETLDRPLQPGERWSLRWHLLLCRGCRQFRVQMDFLRRACRRLGGGD